MSFLVFGSSSQCKNKVHANQDRFGSVTVKSPYGEEVLVSAVSDGVSMCFRGEVASYNVVRFILNWGADYFSKNKFDSSIIPVEFDRLVTSINQNLNNYADSQKQKKLKEGYSPYSSCTLCCVITNGKEILYFGIGDSAIYELKSYATAVVIGGDGASKHKNSSGKLTSYVGGIDDDKLDIRYIESDFDTSSAYLLCTDGMYARINFDIETDEDFRNFNRRLLLADSKITGVGVLESMAEYVLSKGETDDITALVIKNI